MSRARKAAVDKVVLMDAEAIGDESTTVRFWLNETDSVECTIEGGKLCLHTSDGRLVIEPRVSNSVYVEVRNPYRDGGK